MHRMLAPIGAMGGTRLQVREDLNVYSISRNAEKRSERPSMCSGGWGALRGTGPRATGAGGVFFRRQVYSD